MWKSHYFEFSKLETKKKMSQVLFFWQVEYTWHKDMDKQYMAQASTVFRCITMVIKYIKTQKKLGYIIFVQS